MTCYLHVIAKTPLKSEMLFVSSLLTQVDMFPLENEVLRKCACTSEWEDDSKNLTCYICYETIVRIEKVIL